MELRPYQLEFVERVREAVKAGKRRLLASFPTGTGKTIMFAEIIRRSCMNGCRALVLAHRTELIQQSCDKIRMVYPGADIGVVKDERNEHDRQITVASVQTLHRKRLEQLGPYDLIVTDEAHHAYAPSYRRIYHRYGLIEESPDDEPLDVLPGRPIHLGVTATPDRSDRKGLAPIFDEIVFERKYLSFVPEYLADLRIVGIDEKIDLSQIRVSRMTKDFDEVELARQMGQYTPIIYAAYQRLASERKRTLVFCVTREHAYAMCEYFTKKGVAAAYLDYKTPAEDRAMVLEAFRNGSVEVLFNVMLLTEGFDLPEIDCILVARPTKSPLLLTQMIGRGTRIAEGKADCLIIDVAQWEREAQAVTVASLFDLEPSYLKDNPAKTVKQAVEVVEQGAGDEKKKKRQGATDKTVSDYLKILDELMNGINDIVANFEPKEQWHHHAASVKQLDAIERQLSVIGEPMPSPLSKGQAGAIMGLMFTSLPATQKQIGYLRYLGVRVESGLTKSEAKELIDKATSGALPKEMRVPATSKQIGYLKYLGVRVESGLTKSEASRLISERS